MQGDLSGVAEGDARWDNVPMERFELAENKHLKRMGKQLNLSKRLFYPFTHLILTVLLGIRYISSHFTDEYIEVKRG